MNQKLLVIVAVVLLIVGVVLILKKQSLSIPQVDKTQEGVVASKLNIQTKTINEKNPTGRYTLDIQYPEITGFKDLSVEKVVNEKIAYLVTDQVEDFKKNVLASGTYAKENDFMSGLDIRYEIAQAHEDIVSLSLQVSSFAAGAAHPNNYNLTFNYQPSSASENKELTLSHLFKEDSNYLDKLSEISRQDLNNQFKDEPEMTELIKPGTEPVADNFKNFVLKKGTLVLIFDPYQVAPYAAGTRTVSISKDKIKNILIPNIKF